MTSYAGVRLVKTQGRGISKDEMNGVCKAQDFHVAIMH
jgi:hypothetical protein